MSISIEAQDLKVMTYNIRLDTNSDGDNSWTYRKEAFSNQLKRLDADVVGLQEVMPSQREYISKTLIKYEVVSLGREVNDGGESSPVLFCKKRFNLLEQSTFWLSETPDAVSMGWDAACNRVCTYVKLYDKRAKQTIWVFNTHLDHVGVQARCNGLTLVKNRIAELTEPNQKVILMGDFNITPNDECLKPLQDDFFDTRAISIKSPEGPQNSFTGFQAKVSTNRIIDHIYIRKSSAPKVKSHKIIDELSKGKFISDHFPVLAILSY